MRMPGKSRTRDGPSKSRPKGKPFKAKQQKKKFIRSKDPVLAVLMWGVQHSINELTSVPEPSLLLAEDFKAFSKIRVENQCYNKENMPGHFKFKEYCPRVFHDLRKRFCVDDLEYMNSLVKKPPQPIDSPGRSGAKFFVSYDNRVVIKSITSEEVALLHLIIQAYHEYVVTREGKSLLPHYLGMYRLTVNNCETYWIVMRNIFSSEVKIHTKFDLKGSTVDRAASDKEKAKSNPTLKDNDFIVSGGKIKIGEEAKLEFMSLLESDVTFLQGLNLMDYSLLVGIHDCTIPPDPQEVKEEGFDDDDDEEGYTSNDDVVEDKQSPMSPEDMSMEPLEPVSTSGALEDDSNEESTKETEAEVPSTVPESSKPGESAAAAVTTESASAYTCKPVVVIGEKGVEAALSDGKFPVIDKDVDVFAVASSPDTDSQVYFMGIIDVLTAYGARKRAAHAAKTMKHGHGADISTVRPEQYARRILEFLSKSIQ